MTKIGQIFEKEKIEHANRQMIRVAKDMLTEDIDILKIMKVTGFTEEQLETLREEVFETA